MEPLYKMVHYKIVLDIFLDIRHFKCGPQKCCIQTKMYRLHKKWSFFFFFFFLYNVFVFVLIQHGCLANIVFALDPSNSVIKRLWCTDIHNC